MNTPLTDNPTDRFANNGHASLASPFALRPEPQVSPRPTRRRFTVAYKARILRVRKSITSRTGATTDLCRRELVSLRTFKEADACHKPGELGALLRREGLYSSTLANFRKQRQAGKSAEKNPVAAHKQRQDKAAARQRDARRLAALETENQKLRVLLELQKKVAALLDLTLAETPNE